MQRNRANIAARQWPAERLPRSIAQNVLHRAQYDRLHDAAHVLGSDSGAQANSLGGGKFGRQHRREHGCRMHDTEPFRRD